MRHIHAGAVAVQYTDENGTPQAGVFNSPASFNAIAQQRGWVVVQVVGVTLDALKPKRSVLKVWYKAMTRPGRWVEFAGLFDNMDYFDASIRKLEAQRKGWTEVLVEQVVSVQVPA